MPCDALAGDRWQRVLRDPARGAALDAGDDVRVLDVDATGSATRRRRPRRSPTSGMPAPCGEAVDGIDVVYHNVAQVPLARTRRCCARSTSTARRCCSTHPGDARGEQDRAHVVERGVRRSRSRTRSLPDTVPETAGAVRRGEARRRVGLPACRVAGDWTSRSSGRARSSGTAGWGSSESSSIGSPTERIPTFSATARIATSSCTPMTSPRCASAAASSPGPAVFNAGTDRFGTIREALEHVLPSRRDRFPGAGRCPPDPPPIAMQLTSEARPHPVCAISLADVLAVDVVRHDARDGGGSAGGRGGRTTRCSSRATTGSSPTERWR